METTNFLPHLPLWILAAILLLCAAACIMFNA